MTMKERLATAINGICADGKIAILDEARARAEAIDPILERLGWDRFSEDFKREFSVSSGRVDYALFVRGKPEAFIEAKRPSEDLDPHQRQLLTYSALHGVRLAALTNGLSWWLYLPLQVGNFEARRFCQLHICNQDVSEVCDLLIEFLSRENVYSGVAVENAEARLTQLQEAKKVDNALPQAWEDLIAGPDNTLVELINEKVEYLCGVKAGPNHVKEFLVGLSKPTRAVKQLPKFEKKEPAEYVRVERISPRSSDLGLSTLDNIEDKELLHATLSNIVENYIDAKYTRDRGTRSTVKEYMAGRGFIEFNMLAEWGGVKTDRPRLCKVDVCGALHAVNRRK